MAKLIAHAMVLQALASFGCGKSIDLNSLDSRSATDQTTAPGDTPQGDARSDPLGTNCPASPAGNPGQNGSISWIAALDQDAPSEASSVAVNTNDDAFLTKATGATLKISTDGTIGWTKPYGSLVAVTADDRVVVAGDFTGTRELDGVTLSASGGSDVFLATLDGDGNLLATMALGGAGDEHAASLALDDQGRVYLSGPGLGTVAIDGDRVVWQRPYDGFVAVDREGSLLITGALVGNVDFGGGPLGSLGGSDVFVAKLDREGAHRFSARYGDAGAHQEGQAIAADFEGNLLIGGIFDGQLDFGAGALTPSSCPSEVWCKQSGFVAKLAPDGGVLWSRSLGAMRGVGGVAATSTGITLASGALPGNVDPYRMPRLVAFDPDGTKLWERAEWPETGLGAGRQVAADHCDALLWSVSARPAIDWNDFAYLVKLAQ